MGTQSALVRDMLDEYGAATRVRLRDYLAGSEPRSYLYDLAADYPARGGRSLRAGICIATARAFGAATEDALNSAVALEILHNAFLVHDDVEDDSEERRGRPTLHILCGTPLAINVGDGLAVMSLKPLIDNSRFLGRDWPFVCCRRPSGWRGNPSRDRRWSSAGAATTSAACATTIISG